MTDLVLERILPAPVEQVFDFVTQNKNLLKWWGPEGMSLPVENLNFTQPGPWFSVMMNADGNRFKVSGEVIEVRAPNIVAFTWGWHDENDRRGAESVVTIEVTDAGAGRSKLTLNHRDLADEESRDNHNMGWTSSLTKLEREFV